MPQPTNKRRNRRQKVKAQYMKLREEAQLLDLIPTTPQGSVRDEVAVPEPENGRDMSLEMRAVRRGWAVPEDKKPVIVDKLISLVETPEVAAEVKIAAARTLKSADRDQWERDNPELAGKTKASVTQTQATGIVTAEGVLQAVLASAPNKTQQALADLEAAEKEVGDGRPNGGTGDGRPDGSPGVPGG